MSKGYQQVISWQDVLEARGLSSDGCIQDIVDSQPDNQDMNSWLSTCCQPATLLSKEELLYSERTQASARTASDRNTITDQAFEHAITSLHASIANIDQQCKVLQDHKKALLDLRSRTNQHNLAVVTERTGQKNARNKAHLDFETDGLVTSTRSELDSHSTKVSDILENAHSTTAKLIEKDDRILDGLQKIVPRLSANKDDRLSGAMIDNLCDSWIALEQQAMRHMIDDTYEYALLEPAIIVNEQVSYNNNAEDRAVRAELAELSSEVDGMITLVAEHHYRALIKRSLAQAQNDSEAESAKWSEYAACVLLYLTARLDALHELYQHSHVHKAALASLEDELTKVLTVRSTNGVKDVQLHQATTVGRGLKPLRLVQATFNDPQETNTLILKLLGIKGAEGSDEQAVRQLAAKSLSHHSFVANSHLEEFSRQHMQSVHRSLRYQDQHLNHLLSAIHSQTGSGQSDLSTGSQPAMLHALESETNDLAAEMHVLDLEELASSMSIKD